jgi:hypothetical protein
LEYLAFLEGTREGMGESKEERGEPRMADIGYSREFGVWSQDNTTSGESRSLKEGLWPFSCGEFLAERCL